MPRNEAFYLKEIETVGPDRIWLGLGFALSRMYPWQSDFAKPAQKQTWKQFRRVRSCPDSVMRTTYLTIRGFG